MTRPRTVLDYIRRALATSAGGDAADASLLARFLSARDEEAFAALVQRHGRVGVDHRFRGFRIAR